MKSSFKYFTYLKYIFKFSPSKYRRFNEDLFQLNFFKRFTHFCLCANENRIYGNYYNDPDFISMRWLRGNGLEIGAGAHPTPLHGMTSAEYLDIDNNFYFHGTGVNHFANIDHINFSNSLNKKYDFVIASHVLEHCDSFIMAIKNILEILNKDGFAYIVLPDIRFLNERNFIKKYDFQHHLDEFENSEIYSGEHRSNFPFSENSREYIHAEIPSDFFSNEYGVNIVNKKYSFMIHKHNYTFLDWLNIIIQVNDFLGNAFDICDFRFGHERKDCHFVLQKK